MIQQNIGCSNCRDQMGAEEIDHSKIYFHDGSSYCEKCYNKKFPW